MSCSLNCSSLRLALLQGVDSGATASMAYKKAVFFNTEKLSPFKVGTGYLSKVRVHGRNTVHPMLSVNGGYVK